MRCGTSRDSNSHNDESFHLVHRSARVTTTSASNVIVTMATHARATSSNEISFICLFLNGSAISARGIDATGNAIFRLQFGVVGVAPHPIPHNRREAGRPVAGNTLRENHRPALAPCVCLRAEYCELGQVVNYPKSGLITTSSYPGFGNVCT